LVLHEPIAIHVRNVQQYISAVSDDNLDHIFINYKERRSIEAEEYCHEDSKYHRDVRQARSSGSSQCFSYTGIDGRLNYYQLYPVMMAQDRDVNDLLTETLQHLQIDPTPTK